MNIRLIRAAYHEASHLITLLHYKQWRFNGLILKKSEKTPDFFYGRVNFTYKKLDEELSKREWRNEINFALAGKIGENLILNTKSEDTTACKELQEAMWFAEKKINSKDIYIKNNKLKAVTHQILEEQTKEAVKILMSENNLRKIHLIATTAIIQKEVTKEDLNFINNNCLPTKIEEKLKEQNLKINEVNPYFEMSIDKEKIENISFNEVFKPELSLLKVEVEPQAGPTSQFILIEEDSDEDLLACTSEIRSYVDEGQNAASSTQSIDSKKKTDQQIAQTQEQVEKEEECSFK